MAPVGVVMKGRSGDFGAKSDRGLKSDNKISISRSDLSAHK